MTRTLLLALFLWLITLAPSGAQGEVLTVADLATRLDEAAALIEADDVAGAAAILDDLNAVQSADGTIQPLAAQGWEVVLDQPPNVAAATLRDYAERLRDPATTLPADAPARLQAILARPEFQDAQPSLLERFWDWLLRNLPVGDMDTQRLLDFLIGLGGIVVVAIVLFILFRALRRYNVRDAELESPLWGEVPISAAVAQTQASEAANAGNFREAIRLLYLAALLHLDEVGLLRFDRALTNREVLASVPSGGLLYTTLAPVIGQFDRVWYGFAPFGEPEFNQMRDQLTALRQMEQS